MKLFFFSQIFYIVISRFTIFVNIHNNFRYRYRASWTIQNCYQSANDYNNIAAIRGLISLSSKDIFFPSKQWQAIAEQLLSPYTNNRARCQTSDRHEYNAGSIIAAECGMGWPPQAQSVPFLHDIWPGWVGCITCANWTILTRYCYESCPATGRIYPSDYVFIRVLLPATPDNACIRRRESINNFRMAHAAEPAAVKAEIF